MSKCLCHSSQTRTFPWLQGFCCYTMLIRMEFVLTSMYHDLLIGLLAIIILKWNQHKLLDLFKQVKNKPWLNVLFKETAH